MRIVVDTNVLVSAALHPGRVPDRVIRLVASGRATLLYDARVLAEYHAVLRRPRFDFPAAAVDELIALLEENGERVESEPLAGPVPDEGDRPFIEVARSGRAAALVTGNGSHFPADVLSAGVVCTPREFLERWQAAT